MTSTTILYENIPNMSMLLCKYQSGTPNTTDISKVNVDVNITNQSLSSQAVPILELQGRTICMIFSWNHLHHVSHTSANAQNEIVPLRFFVNV